MKNLLLAFLLLGFVISCTQEEQNPNALGDVTFKSVFLDSFSGNLPNGRIAGPSSWKHVFKNQAVLEVKNKVTGEEYKFDYNPNLFGEGFKITLPYGSYTYKTKVSGGAFEKYLPFSAQGEFNLGVASLEVSIQAVTDYGLITVKNQHVKSLGIRHGSELCEFKLLDDKSFFFLYAKKDQVAKLEITESMNEKLIKRDVSVKAYNHYNFFLVKSGSTGSVNFIELALGVFEYVEEGIEIGDNGGQNGLILWNKLGSLEEITNSAFGPDMIPGSGMQFEMGKFGNGTHIPQAGGIRSVHSPKSPRNVIPLGSFSIEFWFKRTHDDEHDGYSFFGPAYDNNGKGDVDMGGHSGYVGEWNLMGALRDNSGNWVGRFTYNLGSHQKWAEFFPKNEWVHIAMSHDATWQVGKRFRVFRNGVELTGLYVEFDTGNMNHVGQYGSNGVCIGNFIGWNGWGAGGVIDNFKVWNYAKTDFSDRDTEGH